MSKFEPWKQFENLGVLKPIAVDKPPCAGCKFWSPRAITDSFGFYDGVTLCINPSNIEKDFSCYEENTNDSDLSSEEKAQSTEIPRKHKLTAEQLVDLISSGDMKAEVFIQPGKNCELHNIDCVDIDDTGNIILYMEEKQIIPDDK